MLALAGLRRAAAPRTFSTRSKDSDFDLNSRSRCATGATIRPMRRRGAAGSWWPRRATVGFMARDNVRVKIRMGGPREAPPKVIGVRLEPPLSVNATACRQLRKQV